MLNIYFFKGYIFQTCSRLKALKYSTCLKIWSRVSCFRSNLRTLRSSNLSAGTSPLRAEMASQCASAASGSPSAPSHVSSFRTNLFVICILNCYNVWFGRFFILWFPEYLHFFHYLPIPTLIFNRRHRDSPIF